MHSSSSTLRTGCLATLLALAVPWLDIEPPPAPALLEIHGLAPRQLKSQAFQLPSPAILQVDAVGLDSEDQHGALTMLKVMWNGKRAQLPWAANAWIIDLRTRAVVWDLSSVQTSRGSFDTRTFSGTVTLPAGSYEAFYGFYPSTYWSDDDKPDKRSLVDRLWNGSDQGAIDALDFKIHGDGRILSAADLAKANAAFAAGSIVNLRATAKQQLQETGFSLAAPTEIEVYALGEARQDGDFDSGWIINADTRQQIWKLTWTGSEPAGGAEKNRMAILTKTLPAGRYAAFYGTDDSHDPSQWNTAPPHDPDGWGLLIRVPNASARTGVKTFAYEHVPAASTFLALTGLGDNADVARGFTIARPMDVRIYALGEGRDGRMFDYGWIVGANHRRLWEMRYEDTEPAGGDSKNRLADRIVHLEPGDYTAYFVTDSSHSSVKWNASAPPDGGRWGMTLLTATGKLEPSAVTTHAEVADPSIIAQLVRVRDNERPTTSFTLARDSAVRIYALGEVDGNEMADYGWIEDKASRRVWEMKYGVTEPAGGAAKNRRFDRTITLPAGEYTLHYRTDGSHAFGEWNAAPPDDPIAWGITVSRSQQ
jgi:hypothetical protein